MGIVNEKNYFRHSIVIFRTGTHIIDHLCCHGLTQYWSKFFSQWGISMLEAHDPNHKQWKGNRMSSSRKCAQRTKRGPVWLKRVLNRYSLVCTTNLVFGSIFVQIQTWTTRIVTTLLMEEIINNKIMFMLNFLIYKYIFLGGGVNLHICFYRISVLLVFFTSQLLPQH